MKKPKYVLFVLLIAANFGSPDQDDGWPMLLQTEDGTFHLAFGKQ